MAKAFVGQYLQGLIELLGEVDLDAVDRIGARLWRAYIEDRHIFIIGNGGSAATASHMACDLAKGATVPGKRRVRAISLTDNVAHMTAIGNDIGYEKLFTEQLANLAEAGDLLVVFTASGNSPNILDALRWAQGNGVETMGVLGFEGGEAARLTDLCVVARSRNYGFVEDFHLILEHALSQWMRERIEREGPPRSQA
ncbi:MAG: SIS domain-containing protein [Armatimonadetes bacterium]|nr:SIS domain-containing protein [Armatimonadota bacterium]